MSFHTDQSPIESLDHIADDLRAHYPNLHLYREENSEPEIRGTFPVRSAAGKELDHYLISIRLPGGYPKDLPIVRELGGRIPWYADYHVFTDGTCCCLLPEDRSRCFPIGAPFKQFLDGPVHDFFLGQSLVALGEPWPFGEWSHGKEGIHEFYSELIGTDDKKTIIRFLKVLTKLNSKPHWDCPCGSGKKIRDCCQAKISEYRRKVPPAVARKSAEQLGIIQTPATRDT